MISSLKKTISKKDDKLRSKRLERIFETLELKIQRIIKRLTVQKVARTKVRVPKETSVRIKVMVPRYTKVRVKRKNSYSYNSVKSAR